jgi:hypothetical protein
LLAAGQVVAGYEIAALVGRGGMGEVYKARQLSMDREVALKILAPRLATKDPSFAKRFVDEARAAGKLNHPNIIHVHDVGTALLPDGRGEVHFFSMEFVDGQSVQEILATQQRLTPAQVQQVMLGVTPALAFAAKAGIVHRDIKPDNIMITRGGLVKLADLGLAVPSQTGDDHNPERDQQGRAKVMGTPLYLSPEQARALPVDHRSDQYSLGATLFHLLTGEPPYRGPDAKSIMKSHVVDPIPDPADLLEDVGEPWRQLTMRLMAKRPDERFNTAEELVEAVEAAAEGVTLEQLERRKRGFRLPPGSLPWVLIGAAGVLLLLAFIALAGRGRATPPPEPVAAPEPPAAVTQVVKTAPPAPAPAAAPAATPAKAVDLAPLIAAIAEVRLGEAQRLLAGLDGSLPAVAAQAKRLEDLRKVQLAAYAARIASASKPAELDALARDLQAKPLAEADQAAQLAAIEARRKALAPPPAPAAAAPTDDDRWRDLGRQLDRCRATLKYEDVATTVEKIAPTFAKPETRDLANALSAIGRLAMTGEGALRAYISIGQPKVQVELDDRTRNVQLIKLNRNEVVFLTRNGAGEERTVQRRQLAAPWSILLDDAIKEQGIEQGPQVKAACLWMWAVPDSGESLTALGNDPLAAALIELEKHRK